MEVGIDDLKVDIKIENVLKIKRSNREKLRV